LGFFSGYPAVRTGSFSICGLSFGTEKIIMEPDLFVRFYFSEPGKIVNAVVSEVQQGIMINIFPLITIP
jgi:hypothetical protein